MMWAEEMRTEMLMKDFLTMPSCLHDHTCRIYRVFVNLYEIRCDGSVGMSFLLRPVVVSQLRVLYRSSSSGLD